MVVAQAPWTPLCIIGDLNSILDEGERAGRRRRVDPGEMREFCEFVEGNGLIDLPLHGRKYTSYKSDGSCRSKIDRALINDKWVEKWSETELRGLPRSISDHCAILFQSNQEDWGPKPFRLSLSSSIQRGGGDVVEG